jgi:hypothetical protein
MEETRDFYGLLGFEEVMNHSWVMTLASPSNPTAQVTFMSHVKTAPVVPDMSIEVDDVDAAYAVMRESGAEVVHSCRKRSGDCAGSLSVTQRPGGQHAEPPMTRP